MKLGTFPKQPGERESYTITYEDDLDAGDGIAADGVTMTVAPLGMTVEQIFIFSPRVRFFVNGGVAGTYKVTVRAVTDDGRILEDEIFFKVKET